MKQQGPWMVNYIEGLAPAMNRWRVPADALKRERDFTRLSPGMTRDAVVALLGQPATREGATATWDAGIKTIHCTFSASDTLDSKRMELLPAKERQKFSQWGVVPFPSAVPGKTNVAFCPSDVLVIPRGSKHKREAFEFIAYINRPDVSERLNMLHCKVSQLRETSRHFLEQHPNPYIEVFESAANSPDAFAVMKMPLWPEIFAELDVVAQQCYLLEKSPSAALAEASERLRQRWDRFRSVQAARAGKAGR
jgi:ABC-type glycerol-3-phosphate transport system substrate-binding protein